MAISTTFSLYATAWNLLYPGEAVLGRRWERRLGEGLPETRFFRLVLLEGGRAPRPAEVPDLRVAVLVPPSALRHAVREEARAYAVEQERGGEAPSHPLPDVRRYTNGRLVTREALGMDLSSLETLPPAQGLSALAAAFFPHLTTPPPLPVADLPRTFGPAEARLLWEGFASPRPSAQGRGAVQDFSRGLGLEASHVPSSVLDLLRQTVAPTGRGAFLETLRGRFAQELRLPPYMASLFGLLAVLWGDLEAEAGLAPDVTLSLFGGHARTTRRIAAGILPALPWTEELEQALVGLLPPLSLTWASLRPYLDLLTTASGSSPGEPPLEDNEATGLLALRQGQLERLKAALASLGEQPLPGPEADSLERFLHCLEARTPEELLARIKGLYPTIVHLAQDAEAVVGIEQMVSLASQARAVRSYLQEALLGSTDTDMEVDRQSLLRQLSLSGLMTNPGLWPGLQARSDLFRGRYATRYTAAHASHHGEMARLRQRLQEASLQVAALERLNRIQELGEPVGEEIVTAHSALLEATRPCPVRPEDLAMNEAPLCQECRYTLVAPLPKEAAEGHLRGLEAALREQYRRLSSEALRQVLARSGQERLDRLLQAAQASDLISLSQVLDDELAAFLAELLRSSPVRVPRRSILERLRERFPTVGEDEINLCAAELAILLREAFEEARREDSDPGLRLTLS